nr:EOG090X02IW [Triops cancriformis]
MDALFACSRCFSRHPFEELSQGQQLCKQREYEHHLQKVRSQCENLWEAYGLRVVQYHRSVHRRALAKTKQDRHAKLAAQAAAKTKEKSSRHGAQPHLSGHNKRPNRPDVTKVGLGEEPPVKVSRPAPRDSLDPNSSDHVVAMTQLREQVAALQKQLAMKDQQLIGKDKQMTELKATQFRTELELRNKIKTMQKEQDAKTESLQNKIKALQKEVAALSKRSKPTAANSSNSLNLTPTITFHKESSNSAVTEGSQSAGSGSDSP